jgi:AcrR family transcriptional regulator
MARIAAPAARDPVLSRERILMAAHAEFARLGLGGARVDRIASQAGLNKRMIYHYFGSKDELFSAVLLANYARKRESEKALQLEQEEPRQAICKLVSLTWNYYLQNPDFLNLLNSANLHQARHLRASTAVRKMHHPFVKMIDTILDKGVKTGVFKPGVDPVQLYITIAGLSYFYLSNQHTLSSIFHRNLLSPKARAQRLAHMTEVVLGFLTPLRHD